MKQNLNPNYIDIITKPDGGRNTHPNSAEVAFP
jgi:hypothetical protein